MFPITAPYPIFTGADGLPLEAGHVYLGVVNQNPETNPVVAYWDEAGTQPISQPIRTQNGYPVRNGTPSIIYVGSEYSITVKDKNGSLVSYSAYSNNVLQTGAFLQAGTGAVLRPAQSKMQDIVSAFDFMTADEIAAVKAKTAVAVHTKTQAALDALATAGGGALFLPHGGYYHTTAPSVPRSVSIYGEGGEASVIYAKSCNGLNFRSVSYDGGDTYYEDFGLEGAAGSTANWGAVESLIPAGGVAGVDSRDGLHFSRLKIRNFNNAFNLEALWKWSASDCHITKVNQAFVLGNYTMVNRILHNYIIHEGGDDFGGTSGQIAIVVSGPVSENVLIEGNQLYGFDTDIQFGTATWVDCLNNDMEASSYGITYGTVSSMFNIKGNYIEVDGAGGVACIFGNGLATEIMSHMNIEGNNLIATAGVSTIGILINGPANTNQFHHRIVGNIISGMAGEDIKMRAVGKAVIENNRCLSSTAVNSIWIGQVVAAPVFIDKNECAKAIYFDVPADFTNGYIVRGKNMVAGVPDWFGTWVPGNQAFTDNGVGGVTATGQWHREGNLCFLRGQLQLTGGRTLAGVAATSFVYSIPAACYASQASQLMFSNATQKLSYGVGSLVASSDSVYVPAFAATAANDLIVFSGVYPL